MSRRGLGILVLLVAGAAALAWGLLESGRASATGPDFGYLASGRSATLLIRHQYRHCHTWSLNGGRFRAGQRLRLPRGSSLTVVDYDVMPHRLVRLAGPKVTMRNGTTMGMMGGYLSRRPGSMDHMGASTTVTFRRAGVYRFRTRAGEDYMPGVRTAGADNVLTLTVTIR